MLERPRDEVTAALRELAASYDAEQRGFDLREVAGGWRFYTREECAPVVERFVSDGQEVRLTQAALETLAVVAYRQPVSRARVSAVRGVNCDGVMRTLMLRGLVEEAGTDTETGAILLPHDRVLPGAARPGRPGRAAGARAVPARARRRTSHEQRDLRAAGIPQAAQPPRRSGASRPRTAGRATDSLTDVPGGVRLQKVLAAAGVGSRRHCEELIGAGRVEVDGEIVRRFGARVDPQHQVIRVDGRRIPSRRGPGLPGAEQARRGAHHDVGRPGPAHASRTSSATGASGCSTSAGWTTTPRA